METHLKRDFIVVKQMTVNAQITGESCSILTQAVTRYERIIRKVWRKNKKLMKNSPLRQQQQEQQAVLESLEVNVENPCEIYPSLYMEEQYSLRVNTPGYPNAAKLSSPSIWGILRGLETFVQTIYFDNNSAELTVRGTSIEDFPRFPYRSLHLDTARHYIPLNQILTLLDGMSYNKLNVFHWHLVDDQSFPYQSRSFPELSEQGAYSPGLVYTQEDVAQVIKYAQLRGIRVIPEFDTPGHTRSWGISHPELLTPCYDESGAPDGSLGPLHPLLNSTYSFMNTLLEELAGVFPDKSLHLGGDEVPFDCWLSNPEIADYINKNSLRAEDLEEIYISKVLESARALNISSIVWQEVFDNQVRIPEDTVVHVWKDWIDYMGEMANVTRAGYNAILSSCWYLDHMSSGGDWRKFYDCDPTFFPGNDAARRRVLGGGACMWSEVVDSTNMLTRVWPRASAAAEKLWSPAGTDNADEAAQRLEEHACRMNQRGVPSQPPNGPGFCLF